MQIILVKPVRKLGKVGDVVNVKDGYGRNFLLPQAIAIRATKENLSKFNTLKNDIEAKNAQDKLKMEIAAKALHGKHLTFVTQSGADGRLFGSISLKLLATSLSEICAYKLGYSNIVLEQPIKFNGVYNVQIMFHPEIITSILVVVAKSDFEAQDALRQYKESIDKQQSTNNQEHSQSE